MIDFHCHVDLYPDPREVIRECVDRRMYVLSVTTTPTAWRQTAALANDDKRIRTALGLHPELASQRKHELELFDQLLPSSRYVGEIGLDGSSELRSGWNDQLLVFTHILASCGMAGGRILSIHSRRAVGAVLDALVEHPHAGTAVLHWYSGSSGDLKRAIELGCWFSVGPPMTSSERGRALVRQMPQERVLTETDGPFSTVGGRRAFPWDVNSAMSGLADIWGLANDEAEAQVLKNLRGLVSTNG